MIARINARNRFRILTAGGALLLGVTLWTSSHSQSIDKPDTPLKVALVLDCVTQPRFQDDMKSFGMSRMLPTAGGHLVAGRLVLSTQKERDLFKIAENSHRDFLIGFYHCAHIPGSFPNSPGTTNTPDAASEKQDKRSAKAKPRSVSMDTPGFDASDGISPVCNDLRHLYSTPSTAPTAGTIQTDLYKEMGKAAHKALPKLLKGQGAQQDSSDWLIVMQPVRAMKASCLKCHEGAKQGDTLGVLAYAVSKKTFADALPTVPSAGPTRGGF
ncbi:MAG: hypothetical protein JWL77_4030 [Chthonomonadaceae bacterium]|nr:hypothetical protein [Chthonomonadaceae bacterium]